MKAGRFMKVLWKIALLFIIVLILFFIMDDRIQENEPLQSPIKHGTAIPLPPKDGEMPANQTSRPEIGLSTLIGKDVSELKEELGPPNRVEPSGYNYEWWIYKGTVEMMVGVENEKVIQLFSADPAADMFPFKIGDNVKDIYRFTIVESEVNVQLGDNNYTFSLNSEDMMNRLLIRYDDLYAQLYIDSEDEQLDAIRFIDSKTLVSHQPYDMAYMGELVTVNRPSSSMQMEVDRAMERQLLELTNQYRENHNEAKLKNDYRLSSIAQKHSQDMALENYFSNESPAKGSLADRLQEGQVEQKKAGENIAFDYVDAIEAVHGWLNSPSHRKVLLDKEFTHIGTGVYGKYFTQDLIRKTPTVNAND